MFSLDGGIGKNMTDCPGNNRKDKKYRGYTQSLKFNSYLNRKVHPTINGIEHRRDELLEYAINLI
jgi:hypothetical protein